VVGADADAVVGDLHVDLLGVGVAVGHRHADAAAVGRELDRVGQKVEHDLPEAQRVADVRRVGHVGRRGVEFDLLLGRGAGEHAHGALHLVDDVEGQLVEQQAVGLDLVKVEDVLDERAHEAAALGDQLAALAGGLVERRQRLEQLQRRGGDAMQRSPQFCRTRRKGREYISKLMSDNDQIYAVITLIWQINVALYLRRYLSNHASSQNIIPSTRKKVTLPIGRREKWTPPPTHEAGVTEKTRRQGRLRTVRHVGQELLLGFAGIAQLVVGLLAAGEDGAQASVRPGVGPLAGVGQCADAHQGRHVAHHLEHRTCIDVDVVDVGVVDMGGEFMCNM